MIKVIFILIGIVGLWPLTALIPALIEEARNNREFDKRTRKRDEENERERALYTEEIDTTTYQEVHDGVVFRSNVVSSGRSYIIPKHLRK